MLETPRQLAIDLAELQPTEMPIYWSYDWIVKGEGQCEGRWNIFRNTDSDPNVTHVIFDCPSADTAKALVYHESSPDLQATRSPIGGAGHPAHADEYLAYCDVPKWQVLIGPDPNVGVSPKQCKTLARYGRVVSMMMVNFILPSATWPTESDLLKWTIVRNDARMVQFAK